MLARQASTWGSAPWVGLVCVLLVVVFAVLSPGQAFLTHDVARNIALVGAGVSALCVGQALLLAAGQIDISQGAIVVISSVIGGKAIIWVCGDANLGDQSQHVAAGIVLGSLAAVAAGAAVGLTNGCLVGFLGLDPLIVTLAVLGITTGLALVVTQGTNISGLPIELQTSIGIKEIAGIPVPALVVAVVVGLIWVAFRNTAFGVHTLAIGSSRSAAERSGVATRLHIVKLFVLSGALCGLAGFIGLARFGTTDVGGHANDALAAIAGAVIGGTRLSGGRTSIVGALLGALLAVILQVGLVVINVDPYYQTVAIGGVLLGAITLDRVRTRARPRG